MRRTRCRESYEESMMKNEITALSVCDLSEAIRNKRLSVRELTVAYIDRIEKHDSRVNAYVLEEFETALRLAESADRRIAEWACDELPPLFGIPYSVKDNFAVAGIRMTCASRMLESFVPSYTAAVCEKADSAGGIMLGKTNLDEFAMGSSTERSIFGPTANPLDLTRTAGGSSGGSAAAVAGELSPWSIGSDTGGSARQPASFCGVVAMKPTYGRVSRFGMAELASSLDAPSPITRCVRDNALVLSVFSGSDPRDMTSIGADYDFLNGIESGVRGLRVGVLDNTDRCTARAARILEQLGADMIPIAQEERLAFLDEAVEIYQTITAAEASSNLARYDGIRYGLRAAGNTAAEIMKNSRSLGFGDEVKRRITAGSFALSSVYNGDYYRRIKRAEAGICERFKTLFEEIDILLMPTTSGIAFRLGSYGDDPIGMYKSDRYTVPANLTGCPALTIPSGGEIGMPVGVTFMGARFSEGILYRAALAAEAELAVYTNEEIHRGGIFE